MNSNSTNGRGYDPLDRALASLPKDIAPSRDLWAGIQAEIGSDAPPQVHAPTHRPRTWMRMAAGVLLVLASSVTTYVITQRSAEQKILQVRESAQKQLQADGKIKIYDDAVATAIESAGPIPQTGQPRLPTRSGNAPRRTPQGPQAPAGTPPGTR